MTVTQGQRILDLLLAGHPVPDVSTLVGVSEAAVLAAARDLDLASPVTGVRGPTGPTGPSGATGSTGPTGPSGS